MSAILSAGSFGAAHAGPMASIKARLAGAFETLPEGSSVEIGSDDAAKFSFTLKGPEGRETYFFFADREGQGVGARITYSKGHTMQFNLPPSKDILGDVQRWATGYNAPLVADKEMCRLSLALPHRIPASPAPAYGRLVVV